MKTFIEKAMTFTEYTKLIDDLLAEGKTTGPNQSAAMYNYGKLNRQRMLRLEKTVILKESLTRKLLNVKRKMIWLVLTEGWCGDAAQNVPIIEKISARSGNIETRYILWDENPALMDKFLTVGARSIPKLIALDADTLEVLGTWRERAKAAKAYFLKMKAQGMEKRLIMENLHRWYLQDKGRSIQSEFETLIDEWEIEDPEVKLKHAATPMS